MDDIVKNWAIDKTFEPVISAEEIPAISNKFLIWDIDFLNNDEWGEVIDGLLSAKDTASPLLDDSDCNYVYGEI